MLACNPDDMATPKARINWKRRPIFVWQIRMVVLVALLTIILHVPSLFTALHPYVSSTHNSITAATPPNPCLGRPHPAELSHSPPTVFQLHLPKTAGTLLFRLLLVYAKRTNGLPCQYVFDGSKEPTNDFRQYGNDVFPQGTVERKLQDALQAGDTARKAELFTHGHCRVVSGPVSFFQRDAITAPTFSITTMREPLSRFVSMYEFAKSVVRDKPGTTGWDSWLMAPSLAEEFANSSSLFHRGFYDESGLWESERNMGLSFHFYGVLQQLSGIIPRFDGIGDPYHFNITNAHEMAEKAMNNLCRTHVVGLQEDMPRTLEAWFNGIEPWINFTREERNHYTGLSLNRTPERISRNVDDHLPERIRQELERRLQHEIRVYQFAKKLVAYRRAISNVGLARSLKPQR